MLSFLTLALLLTSPHLELQDARALAERLDWNIESFSTLVCDENFTDAYFLVAEPSAENRAEFYCFVVSMDQSGAIAAHLHEHLVAQDFEMTFAEGPSATFTDGVHTLQLAQFPNVLNDALGSGEVILVAVW